MRLPTALLLSAAAAALLAGCAMPGEDAAEDEDPLFGLCPQWTQGPGERSGTFTLPNGTAGNASAGATHEVVLEPDAAEHEGLPFDLVRVTLGRLDVDGRLSLRAFDGDGRQLAVRDYRQSSPQLVPVAVLDADDDGDDLDFDVFLSAVSHDAPPAPAPVTLRWTLDGDGAAAEVAFEATFHYKVCGL